MRRIWRGPASSVTRAPPRLSARSSAIACSATTRRVLALTASALVIVSIPGRPFIRPTRTVSLRCPAASLESRTGRPRSTAAWTASPRSMTALDWAGRSAAIGARAEPALREIARGEGDDAQQDLARPRAVAAVVGGTAREQAAPAVPRVARDAGLDGLVERASELLGEL